MPEPKNSNNRTFEAEVSANQGLRLVKDTPPQPTRATQSIPESATGAPRDLVERLMDRIKKL